MANTPPKLTRKQQKFVQGIAEGKSGTQAALAAYDTTDEESAKTIASQNLSKLNVKEALAPILAKHQINLDKAIAPIGDALNAYKQNQFTGEINPDHSTRLQASDRALKLLGVQVETPNSVNFIKIINEQKDNYGE